MTELPTLFYDLGRWAGIIGFSCLSLLIFSGDTARFWDRLFGLDRIIKFQRKFSLFTALFVVLHPVFFMISNKSIVPFLVPDFTYVPLALGILAFYIFGIIMICSQLYKRISYTVWQFIHVLTYVLFFFAVYHVVNWSSDYQTSVLLKSWIWLWLMAVTVGIVYRTQYKIRKYFKSRFYVKEIVTETHDTFTLVLESKDRFDFEAGQFCFLRLNRNKLYARHPFTISSPPQEKDLHFTIKDSGRFTETAAKLKKGDRVIVDGPFGTFTIKDEEKNLVFIAGGVGITPFMSIIVDHVRTGKDQSILLLYGSQTEKDIIFKDRLDKIKAKWLKNVYVLSRDEKTKYEQGYIDEDLLKKHVADFENTVFYICGPEIMKDAVKKALHKMGVSKKDIKVEDFFW